MSKVIIDNWSKDITENTKIYRYLSFEDFISIVEHKKMSFTRIVSWDDTWEGALRKVPYKYKGEDLGIPFGIVVESFYGQCWTTLEESDAMWRIYSKDNKGIKIGTTIEKLSAISHNRASNLIGSKVFYYGDLKLAVGFSSSNIDAGFRYRYGLIKRNAFRHEEEFRLLFQFPLIENEYSEFFV